MLDWRRKPDKSVLERTFRLGKNASHRWLVPITVVATLPAGVCLTLKNDSVVFKRPATGPAWPVLHWLDLVPPALPLGSQSADRSERRALWNPPPAIRRRVVRQQHDEEGGSRCPEKA
jgi:hypothetical protein